MARWLPFCGCDVLQRHHSAKRANEEKKIASKIRWCSAPQQHGARAERVSTRQIRGRVIACGGGRDWLVEESEQRPSSPWERDLKTLSDTLMLIYLGKSKLTEFRFPK